MEQELLLNNVILKTEKGVPRWKMPLARPLIQKGEKNLADFELGISVEEAEREEREERAERAERAEKSEGSEEDERKEKKQVKKPVKKQQKTFEIGENILSLPTVAKISNSGKISKVVKKEMKEKEMLSKMEEVEGEISTEVKNVIDRAHESNITDTIRQKSAFFIPRNYKKFSEFIVKAYAPYKLLPLSDKPDPDACKKSAEESKSTLKKFAYQEFIRDYVQRASPYRGVLVYHGLGSGKTCSSIAGMEALYQKGQMPVYVFTPASLETNYREDIKKCGPFIFRTNNFWTWISIPDMRKKTPELKAILEILKFPVSLIRKQKGIWIPDPKKRAGKDFEKLTGEEKRQVQEQIKEHMNVRIQFKHYNGLSVTTLKYWACKTPRMFDGATVIIDEVHNLTRLINNSNMEDFYKKEPADLAEYIPLYCEKGKKYRIAYLLYRMLCNAAACKIIALSATPIINFPQELGILANLLAGDTRMAEVTIPSSVDRVKVLNILQRHEEVDFAEVLPQKAKALVRFTAVPSGSTKIFDDVKKFKGFVRNADESDTLRERDLPGWFNRIKETMKANGITLQEPTFTTTKLLPDLANDFRDAFIDEKELQVKRETRSVLADRLSGLISYYKGGKADFMAQVTKDEVVYVNMSDKQLEQYTEKRSEEIKRERKQKKDDKKKGAKPGVTYADVIVNQNSTFKIFSRAVCNFAFPDGFERPYPSDYRQAAEELTGERVIEKEEKDKDIVMITEEGEEVEGEEEEGEGEEGEKKEKKEKKAKKEEEKEPNTYELAIASILAKLKSAEYKHLFTVDNLQEMSPKFQAILDRLRESKGPVLVYSNFKKLEGVGLFAVSLEAQENYSKLDIIQTADGWRLSPETLSVKSSKKRYIVYTGDEKKEKRDVLLQIFNGKWSKLHPKLVKQIHSLAGTDTNLLGEIVKVIMITQTGAEGLNLANVRQVHLMEPYWNYVRMEQVKGRAVRICSHMDLPPEERTVDIFTYIAKFKNPKEIDETLKNFDGGLSTDQHILELLTKKKKLADSLTGVMQSSAVDCQLFKTENGSVSCYKFNGMADSDYMFHPILQNHMSASAGKLKTVRD